MNGSVTVSIEDQLGANMFAVIYWHPPRIRIRHACLVYEGNIMPRDIELPIRIVHRSREIDSERSDPVRYSSLGEFDTDSRIFPYDNDTIESGILTDPLPSIWRKRAFYTALLY